MKFGLDGEIKGIEALRDEFRGGFLIIGEPVKIGGDLGKTLECFKPITRITSNRTPMS